MQLLRNLGRRKLRTSLTILGITIGIWALVVFGSMANKINALVAGGSQFYDGKVTVSAKGAGMGFGSPVDISAGDRISSMGGVDVVVPGVSMLLADDASSMSMSMPQMIMGQVAGADQGRETFPMSYASGRALTPADEGAERRGPRLRHRPPARHEGRRHDDPARRVVPGRRDPRAHVDRARHDRGRAPGGGPAAVRQDAPPAGRGEPRPSNGRDRVHGLPDARHRSGDDRDRDPDHGCPTSSR